MYAIAAGVLGGIERGVGALEHRLEWLAVDAADSDARTQRGFGNAAPMPTPERN